MGMASRGFIKRRHVTSNRFSWKLLILFSASLSCVVVLLATSLFTFHHSKNNKPSISISRVFDGPPKIAFLFLVRRNLPLDFLWDAFFQNGNVSRFSIYVHSAPGFVLDESTTRSHFFYGRQISNSIQVSWGESSMIQAEKLLLAAALEDPANQRFVLLSDSFLDAKEGRYNPKMSPKIPREKWRKGSQWITLVRNHAEVIVDDDVIFSVFKKYCKRRPPIDTRKGKLNLNLHLHAFAILYIFPSNELALKCYYGLINLKELQISNSGITDIGITYLRGLQKLTTLNVEGCNITAACLESISDLAALAYLNLNRCGLSDDGFEKFSGLTSLKRLSLAFNMITDACLVHLKGLTNLEYLNLDSCKIGDEGLANLTGLTLLKSLVLSDTEVGNSGLRYISGLTKLEDLNLSFTSVTDNGLKRLSGLTNLKSLNLDVRQITDAGLANLTSLSGLVTLDLFGARISDSGTTYLRSFKNLQSLEICGGGLTDAGVKNIREIVSLTQLNLSQNCNLTDKTLELISGMAALRSLNVSNSRITNGGLRYLKTLKNLRSLTLESCKVNASEIKKIQSAYLPNLISFRPE